MQPVSRGKTKSASKSYANQISSNYPQKIRQVRKKLQFSLCTDPADKTEILPAVVASPPSLYMAVLPQTSPRSPCYPLALYTHSSSMKNLISLCCSFCESKSKLFCTWLMESHMKEDTQNLTEDAFQIL